MRPGGKRVADNRFPRFQPQVAGSAFPDERKISASQAVAFTQKPGERQLV